MKLLTQSCKDIIVVLVGKVFVITAVAIDADFPIMVGRWRSESAIRASQQILLVGKGPRRYLIEVFGLESNSTKLSMNNV